MTTRRVIDTATCPYFEVAVDNGSSLEVGYGVLGSERTDGSEESSGGAHLPAAHLLTGQTDKLRGRANRTA